MIAGQFLSGGVTNLGTWVVGNGKSKNTLMRRRKSGVPTVGAQFIAPWCCYATVAIGRDESRPYQNTIARGRV